MEEVWKQRVTMNDTNIMCTTSGTRTATNNCIETARKLWEVDISVVISFRETLEEVDEGHMRWNYRWQSYFFLDVGSGDRQGRRKQQQQCRQLWAIYVRDVRNLGLTLQSNAGHVRRQHSAVSCRRWSTSHRLDSQEVMGWAEERGQRSHLTLKFFQILWTITFFIGYELPVCHNNKRAFPA